MTEAISHSANHAAAPSSAPSLETLEALLDVTYTWGYTETRAKLRDLYDKGIRAQWIGDDALPWQTDVDLSKPMGPEELMPLYGSDILAKMTPKERETMNVEVTAWTLSQFLHGEQGALLATAQLVDSVRDLDSKLYAGEPGRRRGAPRRRLQPLRPHRSWASSYPVNPHLKTLLDHDPEGQPLGHEVSSACRSWSRGSRSPRSRMMRQQHDTSRCSATSRRT